MYAFKLHKNYLMGNGEVGNGEMGNGVMGNGEMRNGEVACHPCNDCINFSWLFNQTDLTALVR